MFQMNPLLDSPSAGQNDVNCHLQNIRDLGNSALQLLNIDEDTMRASDFIYGLTLDLGGGMVAEVNVATGIAKKLPDS